MIARIWHGRVPASKSDAYYAYLLQTGVQEYAATPGNKGVQALRKTEDGVTHFLLVTLWDSVDAIKRFAGEDYECAKYYPADDEFLLEREVRVQHFEVLANVPDAREARRPS